MMTRIGKRIRQTRLWRRIHWRLRRKTEVRTYSKGYGNLVEEVPESFEVFECRRYHTSEHVCFDDLCDIVLPGDKTHHCHICRRCWTSPNPRQFPSNYKTLHVTREFVPGVGVRNVNPPEVIDSPEYDCYQWYEPKKKE